MRVALAEVAAVTDGTHYTPKPVEAGVPFLTVKDMSTSGLDLRGSSQISKEDFLEARAGNSAPLAGDVLFSKDGTVGKVCVVETNEEFAVLSSIAIIRPDTSRVDAGYLACVLQSPQVLEMAEQRKTGSAVRRIILSDLKRLEFPLPPLPEQRRIASILDEIDQLRTKRRRALFLLRKLIDHQFLEIFVSGEVPHATVSDLLADVPNAIRTGPFGSQLLHSEFTESGVPVLGIDNVVTNDFVAGYSRFISDAKYADLKRFTVRPGDVLITIMGTVGRVAVAPNDIGTVINTKHLCCITLDRDKILPEYLQQYFLLHPVARRYLAQTSKGAIMDGLNMGIIRNLPVHVPSMSAQKRFVQLRRETAATLRAQAEHLSLLDTLFAAFQNSNF